jgi:hypothetical protein
MLDFPNRFMSVIPPISSAALLPGTWHLIYQIDDYRHKTFMGKSVDEE